LRACALRSVAELGRGQQLGAAGEAGEIIAKCEATAKRIVDGWVKTARLGADGSLCMLDRADDVGRDRRPTKEGRVRVRAEASVTEKQQVNLCSVHGKIRRKELREPFWVGRERRVAGNGGRARTLARMSQEVRVIHLLRRVL
jgi:hypothetical protein